MKRSEAIRKLDAYLTGLTDDNGNIVVYGDSLLGFIEDLGMQPPYYENREIGDVMDGYMVNYWEHEDE